MGIIITNRHPWSMVDRIALIPRTDLVGKHAQRMMKIIRKVSTRIAEIELDFRWHFGIFKESPDPLGLLMRFEHEQYKLGELHKYYEDRAYTRKELEDLTEAEWANVDESLSMWYKCGEHVSEGYYE